MKTTILTANSNLRPFITAGVGEMTSDEDKNKKYFQLNAGLGLHYKINNTGHYKPTGVVIIVLVLRQIKTT
ncbi:MAG: hypothetical protein GY787_15885 [Alteromonadales bacterium]|nr:hypothetical protein [Alteromonadales bacterium]